MTMQDWAIDVVTREVRRIIAEARSLSVAEIHKNLEDAADRLEKVAAQHLERESVTTDKKAS